MFVPVLFTRRCYEHQGLGQVLLAVTGKLTWHHCQDAVLLIEQLWTLDKANPH
jgi:hypothetical protein